MDTTTNSNIKTEKELLEHKLSLQQLQINRLLEITQAINNNFSKTDLFKLYQDTLSWEMRIETFALYTRITDEWECVASAGLGETLLDMDITNYFSRFTRSTKVAEPDHPLLREFEFVIPVHHKTYPIAFAFLGEDLFSGKRDDIYETIRFISAITNVIAVAIENKRLFKRQLEQERLNRELELAVQVQNMLIPNNTRLPKNEEYEFSGIYQPHKGVGGDYYDFLEVGDREISFCIADISGKGIAAALLMSNFQANLQSLVHRKYLSVRKFTNRLNTLVYRATGGEKFITFFIARYHLKKKRLRYLNAGHNPPLMYSKGKIHRLDQGCTILGAFSKIPNVEFGEIYLDDDALFLLYTDGLTDLQNEEGEYFDESHLERFLQEYNHLDVGTLNSTLMSVIHKFKGENDFPDDISVLTGRIFKPKTIEDKEEVDIEIA
ncbi:MAG: PP2C family protein-serine/threonine phosphatase [Saprospiraceae bacterium]|nr:PP2C family protein-serine/threonine phosphatase [Saprospiraceae bacterium]